MEREDNIQVIRPDPDSQYRLRSCVCGSNDVGYIQRNALWAVVCCTCGAVGDGKEVMHDAQVAWNLREVVE